MKETRQRLVNEKRSGTLEQIKKKNDVSMKLIDKSKSDRINRVLKMNNTMQAGDVIRKKMQDHFDGLEEERLEIERLIDNRSKKDFSINI